jgi:hypothetical protein
MTSLNLHKILTSIWKFSQIVAFICANFEKGNNDLRYVSEYEKI